MNTLRWYFVATVLVAGALRAETGPNLFAQKCAMCHGADGKAKTPIAHKLGVKDLTASSLPREAIATRVENRYATPAGVQKMPAFKEQLTAGEIQALADFVVTLRSK